MANFYFSPSHDARTRGSSRYCCCCNNEHRCTLVAIYRCCWTVHLRAASAGKVVNKVSQSAALERNFVRPLWHTFPRMKHTFELFFGITFTEKLANFRTSIFYEFIFERFHFRCVRSLISRSLNLDVSNEFVKIGKLSLNAVQIKPDNKVNFPSTPRYPSRQWSRLVSSETRRVCLAIRTRSANTKLMSGLDFVDVVIIHDLAQLSRCYAMPLSSESFVNQATLTLKKKEKHQRWFSIESRGEFLFVDRFTALTS